MSAKPTRPHRKQQQQDVTKEAKEKLRNYDDALLPRGDEYVHAEESRARLHNDCVQEYHVIKAVRKGAFAFSNKKFFAGKITGLLQNLFHFTLLMHAHYALLVGTDKKGNWKVRSVSSNRQRTIDKSSARSCMTPGAYYRSKKTGEWIYCTSVTGTHATLVNVLERFDADEGDDDHDVDPDPATATDASDSDFCLEAEKGEAEKKKKTKNAASTKKKKDSINKKTVKICIQGIGI